MTYKRVIAGLTAVISILAFRASAQPAPPHIQRSQIENMFADMKAHTKWNVDGNLLWGYFFTGKDKDSLQVAANILIGQGYKFVNIHPLDKDDQPGASLWMLHVERVEHHTPESLFLRNSELYDFASNHGLASYDGMDVGPAN